MLLNKKEKGNSVIKLANGGKFTRGIAKEIQSDLAKNSY